MLDGARGIALWGERAQVCFASLYIEIRHSFSNEELRRTMKLVTMSVFIAHERHNNEWRELLQREDLHFNLIGIYQLEGSQLTLIEAKWRE
jgi:hypothetical protein